MGNVHSLDTDRIGLAISIDHQLLGLGDKGHDLQASCKTLLPSGRCAHVQLCLVRGNQNDIGLSRQIGIHLRRIEMITMHMTDKNRIHPGKLALACHQPGRTDQHVGRELLTAGQRNRFMIQPIRPKIRSA